MRKAEKRALMEEKVRREKEEERRIGLEALKKSQEKRQSQQNTLEYK